jgi:hypothetical protein
LGGRRVSEERFREIAAEGRKAAASVLTARKQDRQREIQPVIAEIMAAGITTLRGIAAELNERESSRRGAVSGQRSKFNVSLVTKYLVTM